VTLVSQGVSTSIDLAAPPLYLIGSTGYPNFGDEFIAAAWLRALAKLRPHQEVWLDCPNPGQVTHLMRGLHPGLRVTDTFWQMMRDVAHLNDDEAHAEIERRIHHLGSPRYDLGILTARRAESVHLIGGGYINAVWPEHTRLLTAITKLRGTSVARLVATGQGLAPSTHQDWLAETSATFDYFTVRDEASAGLTGMQNTGDDALLGLSTLSGFENQQSQEPSDEVWVNIQSDVGDAAAFNAAIDQARELLTSPELSGRPRFYLECIPGIDRTGYDRLSDLIPEENFVSFVRLWEQGFPGKKGQAWITSRFHVHLLAAACGASGTALVIRDDYYGTKHQSLLDIGTGWAVVSAGGEALQPTCSPKFRARAGILYQAKVREARSIYP
jgi:hypothetical protein